MKRNNRTGSHLFFLEFIIVLFFFLIVSTVCLRLFARAHGITQRADALSHAQAAAASVAAAVEDVLSNTADPVSDNAAGPDRTEKATRTEIPTDTALPDSEDDSEEKLLRTIAEYLPGASLSVLPDEASDQEGLVVFYDKEFKACTADDARYLLAAALSRNDRGETLDVSVTDYDHTPIYALSVTLHRPTTRKEALQ